MAAERLESREWSASANGNTLRRVYHGPGYDIEAMIKQGQFPRMGDWHPDPVFASAGYICQRVDVKRMSNTNDLVLVTVEYATIPGTMTIYWEEWNFRGSTQATHVTACKNESYILQYYPDFPFPATSIGATRDRVEGVDILTPTWKLDVTKIWNVPITGDHMNMLGWITGKLNMNQWMNYLPGQILCLGSDISRTADGRNRIDYHFEIRATPVEQYMTTLNGDVIVARPMSGFDYIDITWGEAIMSNGSGSTTTKRGIKACKVIQLYDYANFGLLGLMGPSSYINSAI